MRIYLLILSDFVLSLVYLVSFIGWVSNFKKGIADYVYYCIERRLQIKKIQVLQKLVFLLKSRPNMRWFTHMKLEVNQKAKSGFKHVLEVIQSPATEICNCKPHCFRVR